MDQKYLKVGGEEYQVKFGSDGSAGNDGRTVCEVNHPPHYNTGKIEVIEFIEDQKLDYHSGNAVKYICRAGRKDPTKLVQDLEKAIWYIQRRIEIVSPTPRRPNEMNP